MSVAPPQRPQSPLGYDRPLSPSAVSRDIYSRSVPGIAQMLGEMQGTSAGATLASSSQSPQQQSPATLNVKNTNPVGGPVPLRHRTVIGDAEAEEPLHTRVVSGRNEPGWSIPVTSDRRLGALSPQPQPLTVNPPAPQQPYAFQQPLPGGTTDHYRLQQEQPPPAFSARDQASGTAPSWSYGAMGGGAAAPPAWHETVRATVEDTVRRELGSHHAAMRKHFEASDHRLRGTAAELNDALARQDDAHLQAMQKHEKWASEASHLRHRSTQLLNAVLGIAIFSLLLLLLVCVYTTVMPLATGCPAPTRTVVVERERDRGRERERERERDAESERIEAPPVVTRASAATSAGNGGSSVPVPVAAAAQRFIL